MDPVARSCREIYLCLSSATPTEMPDLSRFAMAERMSRKIATLGGRLAHLLAQSPVAQEDVLTRAHTFLHVMYDALADGKIRP